jgi:DNA-binding winged helix-turn-helix (wHTH) protein
VLDTDTRQLFGAGGERHLTPKSLDLLTILIENRPNALAKKDLQDRLWPDTFVTDANLAVLIAEIRTALGDSAREPRYIRTVHRFGYAFAAKATAVAVTQPSGASRLKSAACWLTSKRRRFFLDPGEHIVGRLAGADIHVDDESVSRRHARVVVTGEGATVEDLGSKNGTYVRSARITAPTTLQDRDRVRFGSVSLTFRNWSIGATTRSVTPPLEA